MFVHALKGAAAVIAAGGQALISVYVKTEVAAITEPLGLLNGLNVARIEELRKGRVGLNAEDGLLV